MDPKKNPEKRLREKKRFVSSNRSNYIIIDCISYFLNTELTKKLFLL